ncbi:MAG: GMC family oxidoreductase [Nocardiopsaceae bacterium]|nr:GMC family oxidoreductase [Nocardiopsaceae bacterium]
MEFDYVVVGAGAAGCVVANRLSARPDRTVLLLEHGGRPLSPLISVPKGFYRTLRGRRYLYRYPTRRGGEVWLRGKVLGGSTAVNGMMWVRGAPADWDALAARGNPGWAWDDIRPACQAIERAVGVSAPSAAGEITQAILGSARSYGWQVTDDFNTLDTERIGPTPSSVANGKRVTAYSAFVRSVVNRSNLTVATRARAARLLVDGRRVTGVRVAGRWAGGRWDDGGTDVTARREVIVCAGAVETPLLLERSGIGRPDILRSLGVRLVAASPNVGERLLEQRGLALQVRLKRGRRVSVARRAAETLRYAYARDGFLASAGYDLACQFKSSPHLARPDVQGLFAPLAIEAASPDLRLARHPGILFLGYPIRPSTAGSVHGSGPGPADPPVIDARYLETEADRNAAAPVLDVARGVLGQGPAAELIESEEFPGASVTGPEPAVGYSLRAGGGIYHAVGSAAMGPEETDVTDPRLRVRGTDGLRVADASVLPVQVSGGTAAPAMAVGWRAADFVLQEAQ